MLEQDPSHCSSHIKWQDERRHDEELLGSERQKRCEEMGESPISGPERPKRNGRIVRWHVTAISGSDKYRNGFMYDKYCNGFM